VFGVSTTLAGQALTQLSGKLDVCIEAAGVLLALVRSLLNMVMISCISAVVVVVVVVVPLLLLCSSCSSSSSSSRCYCLHAVVIVVNRLPSVL